MEPKIKHRVLKNHTVIRTNKVYQKKRKKSENLYHHLCSIDEKLNTNDCWKPFRFITKDKNIIIFNIYNKVLKCLSEEVWCVEDINWQFSIQKLTFPFSDWITAAESFWLVSGPKKKKKWQFYCNTADILLKSTSSYRKVSKDFIPTVGCLNSAVLCWRQNIPMSPGWIEARGNGDVPSSI